MAEPKVQLVAPIGNITVPGINVTGVVTATTITADVGVAASIIQGTNLDIGAGIITATSFVGDQIGTYRAGSLTGSPDLVVGVVTSSGFVAQITGDVTGDLTGNVVGTAGSIISGKDLWVGIATATLVGNGSSLVGAAGSAFTHQTVTADGATTSIDLSAGNIITFNQSANTTVSFANTSSAMKITFIRDKDDNPTARTITWPSSIKWNGGDAPTLISNARSSALQIFNFLTKDSGVTWYGWEEAKSDSQNYSLWRVGWDQRGTMALNSAGYANTRRSSPIQLAGNWTGLSNIGTGSGNKMLATKSDGTLWSWGYNNRGMLGLNDIIGYSSPTQVGTDTTWDKYLNSAGGSMTSTLAAKTDGTLWAWGYNDYGVLGQNDRTDRSSPVQIPGTWGISAFTTLTAGQAYNTVIKGTDGTLWSWGYNHAGYLGHNNRTAYSSPVQVGTDANWKEVARNYFGTVALKTNGTLWTWGNNPQGQLGQNDRTDRSSPTQIPGTTWNTIFSNGSTGQNMGAVKTDGTLWMWGKNSKGGLGVNDNANRSSPTQVPGTTWKTGAINSEEGTWAVKTDGTLWAFGYNYAGSLGLNAAYNGSGYSSPVQVGTSTDWDIVAASTSVMWGLRLAD